MAQRVKQQVKSSPRSGTGQNKQSAIMGFTGDRGQRQNKSDVDIGIGALATLAFLLIKT